VENRLDYVTMNGKSKRPVFLDLKRIHLPVMAVLSLGHRVAGILMFLAIPFSVYLLDLSLSGPQGYATTVSLLQQGGVRVLLVLLLWVLAHHFFAGIRFLLIDIDFGVDLHRGRRTAWVVIAAGVLTLFTGALLAL